MFIEQYKLVAHRGLHDVEAGIPENSLPAFEKAMERGHAIELDVRLTEDREIIVLHDENTKRMTGSSLDVSKTRYSTLKKLRLQDTPYQIPMIQDVLEFVDGRVPLLIEIKNNGKADMIEKILMRFLKYYDGPFILESFNPRTVHWLKKHVPNYIRGQLAYKGGEEQKLLEKYVLHDLMLDHYTKPDFIAYDINDLTPEIAQLCKQRQIPLIGWTVKNQQQYEKALQYCDSIIYEGIRV